MESSTIAHDGAPLFQHQPLETQSMIRLIKIRPDRDQGMVCVEMFHAKLPPGDPPRYKCLSYTWGEPTENHAIMMNGRKLNVRENLYKFLELSIGSKETFWIDALCINQQDVVEKGHQVQRMGSIYTMATEVLVWLGDRLRVDSVVEFLANPSAVEWWDRGDCVDPMQVRPRARSEMEEICRHPYWSRVWIVQEVILQRTVWLLVGRTRIDWRAFGLALAARREYDWMKQSLPLGLFDAWIYHNKFELRIGPVESVDHEDRISVKLGSEPFLVRTMIRLETEPPDVWLEIDRSSHNRFWYLLKRHSAAQCTDIRDRIYSLLSLLGTTTPDTLVVDYTAPAASLFWRAGEHYNAWHRLDCVELLMEALRVSVPDLVESLKETPDRQVSVRIAHAFPEAAAEGEALRTMRCWNDRCEYLSRFHCDSRDALVLCPNELNWAMAPINNASLLSTQSAPDLDTTASACIHFLVQPVGSGPEVSYELTVMLFQGLLPIAPALLLPTGNIKYNGKSNPHHNEKPEERWNSMEWSHVEKMRENLIGARIQVPASLIFDYYQHYKFERYSIEQGPTFRSDYGSKFDVDTEAGRFR